MAKKKAAKQEGPSFEARLARVEKIVERLESGEAGLDESLRLYAEGAELIKACRATLAEAEKRIVKLSETAGGDLKQEPFEPAQHPAEEDEEEK